MVASGHKALSYQTERDHSLLETKGGISGNNSRKANGKAPAYPQRHKGVRLSILPLLFTRVYGLAIAPQAWFQQQRKGVEIILVTPEARPLQALGERASTFMETLARGGRITMVTSFHLDMKTSRDGMLVARDGRSLPYDLGLFVPAHHRPAFLAPLPGNGAMVQVDPFQRTALQGIWAVGDVTLTMAHLCGKSKLERENSTKENQCHAKRAKNGHQRV